MEPEDECHAPIERLPPQLPNSFPTGRDRAPAPAESLRGSHLMQPRVWRSGDRKPIGNPPVTDKLGRPWRWDRNLMFWICEGSDGRIVASCQSWQSLTEQHGPLTER